MASTAWIEAVGSINESGARDLRHAMERSGIGLLARESSQEADAGVLLIDHVDASVLGFVRESSREGRARILGVFSAPTGYSADAAWTLLHAGAADTWAWEGCSEALAKHVCARLDRWRAIDDLVSSPRVRNTLVGQSPIWQDFLRQVVEVARFTSASVLLSGESGTGKELVARLLHTLDGRSQKGELVILDCTTVVSELAGSEFFGHERGSFTGAAGPRDGAFALADGGTLFLDEIGELPLALQAQLLRVIQEGRYKRVGGNQWRKTSFRLACATNRDLIAEVAAGRFRHDLYYRIASCLLRTPTLRDRPDDILPLAKHFLGELTENPEPPEFQEPVKQFLVQRTYPGNVRELRQLMSRITTRHVGNGPVTVGDIPEYERPTPDDSTATWTDPAFETAIRRALCFGVNLKDIGKDATETAISVAIADEDGNLQRAARRLGVTDRALQMRRANKRQ